VEGLLDFGRMEAGVAWYRPAPLDVVELVRSVVEEFGREAADSGYRIEIAVGPDPLPAEADREALARALWNLLDNATKYSPDRGAIWVEVVRQSNQAEIRVRDRGLGIPLLEQKEIFGKFVRGAAARAANIKGTGIGLAMVDHILRAHGGSVRVESEPGRGSTFTLQLPCAPGLEG
jgi:two-component system phosphate regulon sensor histidine kinase PhoR